MTTEFDVLGIGSPLMDTLIPVTENDLQTLNIPKGMTTLITEDDCRRLSETFSHIATPGGSIANTIAGLATLSVKTALIGKVGPDTCGQQFLADCQTLGIHCQTHPTQQAITSRAFIFITPDGQRTIKAFIGASKYLSDKDFNPSLIQTSKILLIEGYLWDCVPTQSLSTTLHIARQARRTIAFSLSDPLCVDRNRHHFQSLTETLIDVLFANEKEILALYQTSSLKIAIQRLQQIPTLITAITRSEKEVCLVNGTSPPQFIPPQTVETIVDTTGAGDQFAAGFLSGMIQNLPLLTCASLGTSAAAKILAHYGTRPQSATP